MNVAVEEAGAAAACSRGDSHFVNEAQAREQTFELLHCLMLHAGVSALCQRHSHPTTATEPHVQKVAYHLQPPSIEVSGAGEGEGEHNPPRLDQLTTL